jgi:uncharacterized protein YbbK (DUF523 family)
MVPFDFVNQLKPFVRFIPVCPEVEIGLGTPRDPVRVVIAGVRERLIQPATGRGLTLKMRRFSKEFLNGLVVDGFILKSRSPSCALKDAKRYAGALDKTPAGKRPGIFAEAVLANFPKIAIEDERGLMRPAARARFLTRIFALAASRKPKESPPARKSAPYPAQLMEMKNAPVAPRREG